MTTSIAQPTPSADTAKRPYVAPALVVHGDVQTLTQGKNGPVDDGDGGSFFQDSGG